MKMLMMMNMSLNMMFLIMKHPLSMGLMIVLQTTLISMTSGLMFKSYWFSYILFLVYIGGMMVLFMYMTSLMPNIMFSMSKSMMIMIVMMIAAMMILQKKYNIINKDMMLFLNKEMMLMKMYNMPVNISIMLMASYLLFSMITVFKITESNKGPLRIVN
uniref:NADH-ubiquinone oxidoreductase chain 6 n=1 Tax=Micadina phluctainoides TaxID=590994 RepID=E2RUZ3_MICPD|nr:NADH dehydrogenase subunit 6 [Micadina phluctainoides]BAJ24527.1 NADH dehydrogenase subunit 6 [Micadina phluctainoides]